MIYFLCFAILLLLPKNKKCAVTLFFLVLWSLAACRYNVGYDYENYYAMITGESDASNFERLEWTSKWLMTAADYMNFPQFYFIVTSLLIMLPFSYVLWKESEDFNISALLFYSLPIFYLSTLSLIRQSVACGFIFLAMYLFIRKKYKLALLFFVIACQFHISALICIVIPLAAAKWWSLKLCVLSWLISLLGGMFGKAAIASLIVRIPAGSNPFLNKIQNFMLNQDFLDLKGYKGIYILFNMIMVFLFPFYEKLCNANDKYKQYFHTAVLGICLFNFTAYFGVTGGRASIFFFTPVLLLLPALIDFFKQYRWLPRIAFMCLSLLLLSYTLYLSYSNFQNGITEKDSYFPYKTFWSGENR